MLCGAVWAIIQMAMVRSSVLKLSIIIAILILISCASKPSPNLAVSVAMASAIRAVEKSEQAQFSPEQEYFLGRAVSAGILSRYRVYANDAATQYISLIGKALAIHCALPETFTGYHFLILDSAELNGFAAPGGFVFITRGLLLSIKSEDMIAGALAYSISHVVMHSGVSTIKEYRRTMAFNALGKAASKSQNGQDSPQMDEMVAKLVLDGLNTTQVLAADHMAVQIMNQTGYDANAYLQLLDVASRAGGDTGKGEGNAFPTWEKRMSAVKQELERMEKNQGLISKEYRQTRFEEFSQMIGN